MIGKELVQQFLLEHVGEKITEARLQIELYAYQARFNKHYLPDSLSRYFRMVRDNLGKYECKEVKGEKHKTWIIERRSISGLHF